MNDPLANKCDEFVEIHDDDTARIFLLHLGLLDEFVTKPSERAGEWAESAAHANHRTHWVLATRFSGFTDPRENGFIVQCWPKSLYSLDQVNALLHSRSEKLFPGGLEVERYGDPIDPSRN